MISKKKSPLARVSHPVRTKVNGKPPDINSKWVEFDSNAMRLLSQYLDDEAITELREACSFVGALYHHRRANPIRYASERKQFLSLAEAAEQLAACLEHGSKDHLTLTAIIELGSNSICGTTNTTELRRLLQVLSDGCRACVERFPLQARRKTPEYQVRWIARIIEPRGVKVSAAPGSKFTRITRVCFTAMGVHSDPGRAIRSYIDHKDDDPLRD